MKRLTVTFSLLLLACQPATADPTIGGPTAPDGKTVVQIDLPANQRMKNIGSKIDQAGMCVFSSAEHSLRWHALEAWRGFRDWCAGNFPGGGWPDKFQKLMDAYAKAKGITVPEFIQYEGTDPTIIIEALKSGRIVAGTYNGRDSFYGRSATISHMVNFVCYTDGWAAILDNNHPVNDKGEDDYVWMTYAEFQSRWCGNGSGWCIVFLAPSPPPIPVNAVAATRNVSAATQNVSPVFGVGQSADVGTVYQWVWKAESPNHVYLCHGWRVVGAWHYGEQRFYWREPGKQAWRRPVASAPFAVPRPPVGGAAGEVVLGTVTDYGVPLWRFPYAGKGEDSYRINGKPVSREEAIERLRRPHRPIRPLRPGPRPQPAPNPGPAPKPLPNDSGFLRVTVSGDAALCARVQTDFQQAPALAVWRDKVVPQYYTDPQHWHLTGVKLLPRPGISIMDAPGLDGKAKEFSYQPDYSGPADLALALGRAEALRRPSPDYDPSKTPDLRKAPLLGDGISPTTIPVALMALFGLVLLLPGRKPPVPPAPVANSTPNTQRGALTWILPQLP